MARCRLKIGPKINVCFVYVRQNHLHLWLFYKVTESTTMRLELSDLSANISSRLTKANRSVTLTNKYLVTYDSLSSYWSFCSLRTIYPFSNITRGFAQNGHANILTRPSSLKSRRVQTKTNISGEKKRQ